MIIIKTPLRISFAGGGTDLPGFYKKFEGKVISSTIDKFIYIIIKRQYGFVEFKYRINWRKTEFANKLKDIEHPIVRETLKYFKINFPIEITTFSDIPARTGLGSSSAFAVGLINGISKLLNKKLSKNKIAEIAFFIEVNLLKRQIGKQDHYSASFGGLNKIIFKKTGNVKVKKIITKKYFLNKLERNCLLLFTNKTRNAHDILKKQSKPVKKQILQFNKMKKELNYFEHFFAKKKPDLNKFGELLNQQWSLKKKVNNLVRSVYLDKVYNRCINAGAYGGKLLGAGNGGFYLLTCNNLTMRKISSIFGSKNIVKFKFNDLSSSIILTKEK